MNSSPHARRARHRSTCATRRRALRRKFSAGIELPRGPYSGALALSTFLRVVAPTGRSACGTGAAILAYVHSTSMTHMVSGSARVGPRARSTERLICDDRRSTPAPACCANGPQRRRDEPCVHRWRATAADCRPRPPDAPLGCRDGRQHTCALSGRVQHGAHTQAARGDKRRRRWRKRHARLLSVARECARVRCPQRATAAPAQRPPRRGQLLLRRSARRACLQRRRR